MAGGCSVPKTSCFGQPAPGQEAEPASCDSFVSPFLSGCALSGLHSQPLMAEETRRVLIRMELDQQIPTRKCRGWLKTQSTS